ncbi:MAG: hypothetical protein NVSMB43_23950 [Pseudarthrobacter sp.]
MPGRCRLRWTGLHTAAAQQSHGVQDVDQRPAQAVNTPHSNVVAFPGVFEESFPARPRKRRLDTGGPGAKHDTLPHTRGKPAVQLQLDRWLEVMTRV